MTESSAKFATSGVRRCLAWSVHLLTASGLVFVFLATAELFAAEPEPRWVFAWLMVALVVDAIDGPLARRWHVGHVLPEIDGRKIDDIVDFLSFTFGVFVDM